MASVKCFTKSTFLFQRLPSPEPSEPTIVEVNASWRSSSPSRLRLALPSPRIRHPAYFLSLTSWPGVNASIAWSISSRVATSGCGAPRVDFFAILGRLLSPPRLLCQFEPDSGENISGFFSDCPQSRALEYWREPAHLPFPEEQLMESQSLP